LHTAKKVDLASLVVPAKIVPAVLQESARVGVKAAIIISEDFENLARKAQSSRHKFGRYLKNMGFESSVPTAWAS